MSHTYMLHVMPRSLLFWWALGLILFEKKKIKAQSCNKINIYQAKYLFRSPLKYGNNGVLLIKVTIKF